MQAVKHDPRDQCKTTAVNAAKLSHLSVVDKHRYLYTETDFPPLGKNPSLAPLNRKLIRSQLSFLAPFASADRLRAVKILLERIADYFSVAGYVGPDVCKGGGEIGVALGEWVVAKTSYEQSRRRAYFETNAYLWAAPEAIFNDIRFLCVKSALRLAAYEVTLEVPESADAIKYASWAAYAAIINGAIVPLNWRSKRNRLGTKGIRKHINAVVAALENFRYETNPSTPFLGKYVKATTEAN